MMNDEEIGETWRTLEPDAGSRRRIERRVFAWLDAHDTPLAAEWVSLFRTTPFAAFGLATVSAFSIVATPLVWFAGALL